MAKKVKQITRVVLVVDRSGSMNSIVQPARDAILEQINTIKLNADKSDETYLSIVSFDNEINVIRDAVKVDNDLTVDPVEILQPRGLTALNDAVKKSIDLLRVKRQTSGTANLLIVISDGAENCSTTKSSELSSLIKELENTGRWTFTFMLANVDIHQVADRLSLNLGNVASFQANAAGVAQASYTMSDSTNSYFLKRSTGVLRSVNFYSNSK